MNTTSYYSNIYINQSPLKLLEVCPYIFYPSKGLGFIGKDQASGNLFSTTLIEYIFSMFKVFFNNIEIKFHTKYIQFKHTFQMLYAVVFFKIHFLLELISDNTNKSLFLEKKFSKL